MADSTSDGADLPTMSDADTKAFADMEAAATAERTGMKGLGGQTVRITQDDNPEPVPTPVAATPAAPAAPAPAPAAPVAAPAAPPPGAQPTEDDDPNAVLANDGKKYVPLGALTSERTAFKGKLADLTAAKDAEIAEAQRVNKTLLDALAGRAPAPAPAPAAAPAPEVNPFDKTTHPLEHLEWNNEKLQKRLDTLEGTTKQTAETAQQERALGEAKTAYVSLHNDFASRTPGYSEAYKWYMDKLTAVGEALGMTKAQAIQAANQQEWTTVQTAVTGKQHPSEIIFRVAKAAGWAPGAPDPTAAALPGAQPAAVGAPAAPALTPAKQIELAQQGAAAAISLSDAAGGTPPAAPTLASLAQMSKEEFAAVMSGSKGDALFRKMAMGGGSGSQAA